MRTLRGLGALTIGVIVMMMGCTFLKNPNSTETVIAFKFSDDSKGMCSLKNNRGSWKATVPNRGVIIRRSKAPLQYHCTTNDGRKSIGRVDSKKDLGKMLAGFFLGDFGGSDRHRLYPQKVVILVERKPYFERIEYDKKPTRAKALEKKMQSGKAE